MKRLALLITVITIFLAFGHAEAQRPSSGIPPHKMISSFHTDTDASTPPSDGDSLVYNATTRKWGPSAVGTGDVVGPSSSTDGYLACFDGETGLLLKECTEADVRDQLGLVPGEDVQEYSTNLDIYAAIPPSADVQTMLGSANNAAILDNIGALPAAGAKTDNSTASHFLYVDSDGEIENATTTGTGTTMVLSDSPVFDDDITVGGATGVKITGSNGSITFLGLGDGADEDLKIDLNTTTNSIDITSPSSSATQVRFGALNLVTTGTITGAIKINSDVDGMSSAEMTTAGMYGTLFVATGAGTWNLPAAVAGMNFCMLVPSIAAVIINPDDSDVLIYDGTADTAGHQIAGGAAAGDFICFIAVDGTNWHSMGRRGTWTPGS